ncbi:hypothetical protein NDU88_008367 [Pleurodeles waltl]|uniref:Uncharacterized protein n=1 Tax=Pleurodeles waltl TaxID=8319 RepID=A0AAV7N6F2_PLEWA|nr:hypothetical protein NDU88_008367 [Pleurodeles waltl]
MFRSCEVHFTASSVANIQKRWLVRWAQQWKTTVEGRSDRNRRIVPVMDVTLEKLGDALLDIRKKRQTPRPAGAARKARCRSVSLEQERVTVVLPTAVTNIGMPGSRRRLRTNHLAKQSEEAGQDVPRDWGDSDGTLKLNKVFGRIVCFFG